MESDTVNITASLFSVWTWYFWKVAIPGLLLTPSSMSLKVWDRTIIVKSEWWMFKQYLYLFYHLPSVKIPLSLTEKFRYLHFTMCHLRSWWSDMSTMWWTFPPARSQPFPVMNTFVLHIANTVVEFSSYIQVVYLHMGTILEAFHHNIPDASITPENAIIMNLPEIDFKQNYNHIYLCLWRRQIFD